MRWGNVRFSPVGSVSRVRLQNFHEEPELQSRMILLFPIYGWLLLLAWRCLMQTRSNLRYPLTVSGISDTCY
jgi:hypothetical protein